MFKLTVNIFSKSPERLAVIARILSAIHYLSGWGATRDIRIFVDGDGASDIKVEFPDLEKGPEPLSKETLDKSKIEYFLD